MKWQTIKIMSQSGLRSTMVFLSGLWQLLAAPFVLAFILLRGSIHILWVMIFHFIDTPRRRYKAKELWQHLQAGDYFYCYESNPYLGLNQQKKDYVIVKVLHVDGKIYPDFFYESYGRNVFNRKQLNIHILIYPDRFTAVPIASSLNDLPVMNLQDVANVPNLNVGAKTSILSVPKEQFCDPDHWTFFGKMRVTKEEMLYFAAKSSRNKAYQKSNAA